MTKRSKLIRNWIIQSIALFTIVGGAMWALARVVAPTLIDEHTDVTTVLGFAVYPVVAMFAVWFVWDRYDDYAKLQSKLDELEKEESQ